MTYCPNCNEYISGAFLDYSYSDDSFDPNIEAIYISSSSEEDYQDFAIMPDYTVKKRTREEAGLSEDLPATRKKRFLGRESLMQSASNIESMCID